MEDSGQIAETTGAPRPDGDGQAVHSPHTTHHSPLTEARHAEIEAKQEQVGALLSDVGADGLFLLDPANVAWLCGAALHQGVPDPNEWPAVFLTPTQRWLVAGNADSQRLFDIH